VCDEERKKEDNYININTTLISSLGRDEFIVQPKSCPSRWMRGCMEAWRYIQALITTKINNNKITARQQIEKRSKHDGCDRQQQQQHTHTERERE
jgi:hypothetical protein